MSEHSLDGDERPAPSIEPDDAFACAADAYERFFDLSLDLLCIVGLDGRFRRLNPAWERAFGYSVEHMLSRTFIDFVHPDDREATAAELARVAAGEPVVSFTNRYRHHGGAYLSLHWTGAPGPDGRTFYASARDVTQVLEADARRARDVRVALDEANRAKTDFLARMSHELRTPLNSVIGFSNILLRSGADSLSTQWLEYLRRIHANGNHLLEIVNDILDLSNVQAGRVRLNVGVVDLGLVVRDTVLQFEERVADRPVELVVELPEVLTSTETDESRLRQILAILVGNAVKFTSEGQVTLRVETDPRDGRPIALEVADTGIGIPEDQLASIFSVFHQVDAGASRKYEGTGLGLTIAQSLCQLMGYRLGVASEEGRGATFRVDLCPPLAAPAADSAVTGDWENSLPAPDEGERTKKIALVVDNDADARLLLADGLEECGYRVVSAPSGAMGLRAARVCRPDIIALELLMPEMSGWDLLRELRDDPQTRGLPVLVVSVVGNEQRGRVDGVLGVLDKPVDLAELERALDGQLRPPRHKVLVVDDNAGIRYLLRQTLAARGIEIDVAATGEEALEKLRRDLPDMVILDLRLPGMSGIDVVARIRHTLAWRGLPIAVITGAPMTDDERRQIERETAAIIRKGEPMIHDLLTTVGRVLKCELPLTGSA